MFILLKKTHVPSVFSNISRFDQKCLNILTRYLVVATKCMYADLVFCVLIPFTDFTRLPCYASLPLSLIIITRNVLITNERERSETISKTPAFGRRLKELPKLWGNTMHITLFSSVYSEPGESSPTPTTISFEIHFNIIFPSTSRSA
jgi:hypothetical protein